jgi:hypothetical protein
MPVQNLPYVCTKHFWPNGELIFQPAIVLYVQAPHVEVDRQAVKLVSQEALLKRETDEIFVGHFLALACSSVGAISLK